MSALDKELTAVDRLRLVVKDMGWELIQLQERHLEGQQQTTWAQYEADFEAHLGA